MYKKISPIHKMSIYRDPKTQMEYDKTKIKEKLKGKHKKKSKTEEKVFEWPD